MTEGQRDVEMVAGALIGNRWELVDRRPVEVSWLVHDARDTLAPEAAVVVELFALSPSNDADELIAAVNEVTAVEHPDLLTVLDVGVTDAMGLDSMRWLYLVTEPWSDVPPDGPRSEEDLRVVAGPLAGGLAALHETGRHHGSVHRRSLRRTDGGWRLAPGGLASVSTTEVAAYRPPGLGVMEEPSPAADMWNTGVVLHELATGRLLRPGERVSIEEIPVVEEIARATLVPDPDSRMSARSVVDMLVRTPLGYVPARPRTTDDPVPDDLTVRARPSLPGAYRPAAEPTLSPAERSLHGSAAPTGLSADVGPARPSVSRWLLPLLGVAAGLAVLAVVGWLLLSDRDGSATDVAVTDPEPPAGPVETEPEAVDVPTTGEVELTDLQVGDCIELTSGRSIVESAIRISCEEEHTAEVMTISAETSPETDYPGRQALEAAAFATCTAAFSSYVGGDYLLSVLAFRGLVPTFGEWDSGRRRATVCVATRYDGRPLTGSVAGSHGDYLLLEGVETSVGKLLGGTCFDHDGPLDNTGKRQDVTIKSCINLHRFEILTVGVFGEPYADNSSVDFDNHRPIELFELASEECATFYDAMLLPDEVGDPTVHPVIPDNADWNLNDPFYLCVAEWSEPVVTQLTLANLQASTSTTSTTTTSTSG